MDCSCNTIDGGMTHQPEEAFVFHPISSKIPRQAKVSVPATSHDGVSCYKHCAALSGRIGQLLRHGTSKRVCLMERLSISLEGDPRRPDHRGKAWSLAGDNNLRYALIIGMLLGSTLLVRAEPVDREKWVRQTARASKSCFAKFQQKFRDAKDHSYANCVTDQTNKAIDGCVGGDEFSDCVKERSLKVLEACDLSGC